MGCGDSQPEKSYENQQEEARLCGLEAALGFQEHSSQHLDLYIRKYASTEEMNKNQYKLIGQKLNITFQSTEKLRTAAIYFSNLLYYKGIYDRTRLLVIAIMMGSGLPEDKAKLLFEIFDTELTNKIQIQDAALLVSVMAKASIQQIECLISYELLSPLATKNMQSYLAKLNSVLPDVENQMQETLFSGQDTYNLARLLRAVQTQKGARMLNPSGIRKLAVDIYEEKTALRASLQVNKKSWQKDSKPAPKDSKPALKDSKPALQDSKPVLASKKK